MSDGSACRICGSRETNVLLDLGILPFADAFPSSIEAGRDRSSPLAVMFCRSCALVQLRDVAPPETGLYRPLVASPGLAADLERTQPELSSLRGKFNLSSNSRVMQMARSDGFIVDTAAVPPPGGTFDLVLASDVLAHASEALSFLTWVRSALDRDGVCVMEGGSSLEALARGRFDSIRHDQLSFFSLHSLMFALEKAGLRLLDVETDAAPGAVPRVCAGRDDGGRSVQDSVTDRLVRERTVGLNRGETFGALGAKAERVRRDLRSLVEAERKDGRTIVGVGAWAPAVLLLNFARLGKEEIAFVMDDAPEKRGTAVPGVGIPVQSWPASPSNAEQTFLVFSDDGAVLGRLREHAPAGRVILPFQDMRRAHLSDAAPV